MHSLRMRDLQAAWMLQEMSPGAGSLAAALKWRVYEPKTASPAPAEPILTSDFSKYAGFEGERICWMAEAEGQ
jgi:hypothetical protein